jgi:hypothetical protein
VTASRTWSWPPGQDLLAHVQVWDGRSGEPRAFDGITGITGFVASGPQYRQGTQVAVGDTDGDGVAEKVHDGIDTPVLDSLFAYGEDFAGGLFVAGS